MKKKLLLILLTLVLITANIIPVMAQPGNHMPNNNMNRQDQPPMHESNEAPTFESDSGPSESIHSQDSAPVFDMGQNEPPTEITSSDTDNNISTPMDINSQEFSSMDMPPMDMNSQEFSSMNMPLMDKNSVNNSSMGMFPMNINPQSSDIQDIQMRSPGNSVGFPDNGSIHNELPVPVGEQGKNPQINREIFNEAVDSGDYSQSEDYSCVYYLGNVSENDYDYFSQYMNILTSEQSSVMESFLSSGWKIILTSADLDELLFNGQTENVAGCTYSSKKEIYVETGDSSYCVIHEIGHYIDYVLNYASQTEEFQSIYASEAGSLTNYGTTSAEEFFAEVYMYSLLEPETTAEKCPLAYAYVTALAQTI